MKIVKFNRGGGRDLQPRVPRNFHKLIGNTIHHGKEQFGIPSGPNTSFKQAGCNFFDRPGGKILLLTSIFDARNIQHEHFIKNFKSPSQLEHEF